MINQNLLTLSNQIKRGLVRPGETFNIQALPSGDTFETQLLVSGNKLQERGKNSEILSRCSNQSWRLRYSPRADARPMGVEQVGHHSYTAQVRPSTNDFHHNTFFPAAHCRGARGEQLLICADCSTLNYEACPVDSFSNFRPRRRQSPACSNTNPVACIITFSHSRGASKSRN